MQEQANEKTVGLVCRTSKMTATTFLHLIDKYLRHEEMKSRNKKMDKRYKKEDIPENAVVAIPNDGTNEYRALRILELNGFIKLDDSARDALSASVSDITEYLIPIEIVELDSAQIIPTKDDYDFFITNTNKALEAKITSAKLFSEGADSPYANIIAVRAEDKDNPAIQALVQALLDEDTQAFIESTYNGAVVPVK